MGEEAQSLLQSALIQGFFNDTEKALLNAFKTSRMDDYEGREKVYSMIRLLSMFKASFEQYIAGGKIAKDMLQQLEAGAFNNL